jgi:signal transduction histidine kinase
MKFHLRERALTIAVVVTTLVVIVLAVLQYRWSNRVSEATGVRLADTLQLSMVNWHLDFLRNFSEICLTMRIDRESGSEEDLRQYAGRFAEWRAVARYPDLVANVYFLKSASSRPAALRLNPATRQFQLTEWPSHFQGLDELPAWSNVSPPGVDGLLSGSHADSTRLAESFVGEAMRGWRFDPEIPALLHRVVYNVKGSADSSSDPEPAGWIAIELRDEVIATKIFPDLAHRYFQGTDGLDYQVAVVAGTRARRVIYSSDPGFGDDEVVDADGVMNVFGRAGNEAQRPSFRVFHKTSENTGPPASVSISWFPLARQTPADEDWQLVVRHRRGGPLGAFVADMHRRDLAVSFGVLLLLVLSMAMLIITSNRAQRLATLQMDFVTAVSHELRTPLTVISSAADNIAQGVVHGKDQLTQYGSVISHQVRQLSALVEQILLFAGTNREPQRFTLQPVAVPELIDATLASSAGLIQAGQFSVEREIERDLPPVMGDLVALSQCLQNLITNALKYGREQRWIGVRAGVAPHGANGRELRISISDRGIGIDPVDLPHIFEPFYRSSSAAAAQIHGTGLGLTLAKRIAEAMKGQLTVTSEPGRGSTFTLHLPCAEPLPRQVDVDVSASVAPAR